MLQDWEAVSGKGLPPVSSSRREAGTKEAELALQQIHSHDYDIGTLNEGRVLVTETTPYGPIS